jgi:penicillin-binding protein 2
MPTDWQELSFGSPPPPVVDPRRRLRWCIATFAALLLVVWCRAAQLEISQGAAFRAEALRPIRREKPLPAARGRILARDGTVLACDRIVQGVAIDYRWLEDPPRQAWLEQTARKRLPKDQRRSAARLAQEVEKMRQERDDLHRRLAALCGIELAEWQFRARKVQENVERIAAGVRQRQLEAARAVPPPPTSGSWSDRFSAALHDIFAPARDAVPAAITVAEELSDHVLAEDISAAAVAEIQSHGDRYPGTRIVQLTRRSYPHGELAAHVLGYLGRRVGQDCVASAGPPIEQVGGPALASSLVPPYEHPAEREYAAGITGMEQECDGQLRGRSGTAVETLDHAGRAQQTAHAREPVPGGDVTLTIDAGLQQTAEELLDSALKRAAMQYNSRKPSGGAIVVLDVHSGEILALASAPRFDPALFAGGDSSRRAALLADPASPLFHRAIQMALPPGAVFKTLTAAALLESGGLDPAAKFHCRGYLDRPDQQRCAIYVRQGTGHGDITLGDALAESCNVYFFHHVESLPPDALADWSRRFGFGQRTGVDLPSEARGAVPSPETNVKLTGHRWHTADTQAMAVGQGALTATPLQVARMMAAVANGGLLVTPHAIRAGWTSESVPSKPQSRPIPGLTYSALAAIRAGLLRAVEDKNGTAHDTLYLEQVSIAGATGTAATGGDGPEHAWFAGYVPANRPRYAMVVILERAGDAPIVACPVARRLVLKLLETGLLAETQQQPLDKILTQRR